MHPAASGGGAARASTPWRKRLGRAPYEVPARGRAIVRGRGRTPQPPQRPHGDGGSHRDGRSTWRAAAVVRAAHHLTGGSRHGAPIGLARGPDCRNGSTGEPRRAVSTPCPRPERSCGASGEPAGAGWNHSRTCAMRCRYRASRDTRTNSNSASYGPPPPIATRPIATSWPSSCVHVMPSSHTHPGAPQRVYAV